MLPRPHAARKPTKTSVTEFVTQAEGNSKFSRDVTDYANVVMRHVGVPRSVILHVNRGKYRPFVDSFLIISRPLNGF